MNILINGICGQMGREVLRLSDEGYKDARVVAGVDTYPTELESVSVCTSYKELSESLEIDCIIDFSHHTSTPKLLEYAVENSIPTVIATTGHDEAETEAIKEAANSIPVFFSANMSLGVALLVELAKTVALAMPEAEIEIIEKHHNRKLDAPSGTALMIANAIGEVRPESYVYSGRSGQGRRRSEEIGIHAIRMGNIVGEHEVIVGTPNQTITLKHEAHSRALFAEGALSAASFIVNCRAGLYDMKSLVTDGQRESALSGADF